MNLQIPRLDAMNIVSLEGRWTGRYSSMASADAAISWEPSSLYLRFDIYEPQIRALETDPWLVHRDS